MPGATRSSVLTPSILKRRRQRNVRMMYLAPTGRSIDTLAGYLAGAVFVTAACKGYLKGQAFAYSSSCLMSVITPEHLKDTQWSDEEMIERLAEHFDQNAKRLVNIYIYIGYFRDECLIRTRSLQTRTKLRLWTSEASRVNRISESFAAS
jgi:hypothetical protein